jgi:hypothetical protein
MEVMMDNMSSLDDLLEIDDYLKFKTFIKKFILENENLYRLIYFSMSNPLDEITCVYPEDPYGIFDNTDNTHGVVLFDKKNDTILNTQSICVLIDFESTLKANSKEFNSVYILVRVLAKGSDIRKLSNEVDRISAIIKIFDDEFNTASVNGLGETRRQSISSVSVNEENVGNLVTYKANSFNSDWSTNKNFKKRILRQ